MRIAEQVADLPTSGCFTLCSNIALAFNSILCRAIVQRALSDNEILGVYKIGNIMDQISKKTPNPKYRLF
jgi:hypothetical protein